MIKNRIKVIFIFFILIFIFSNNLSANVTIKNYENNNIFGFEVFNDAQVNITGDDFIFIGIPSISGFNNTLEFIPSCPFVMIICVACEIVINSNMWEDTAAEATVLAVTNMGIESSENERSVLDLPGIDIFTFDAINFFGAKVAIRNF